MGNTAEKVISIRIKYPFPIFQNDFQIPTHSQGGSCSGKQNVPLACVLEIIKLKNQNTYLESK
jgi:hypothetical protein